jgi:hypothetical protein
MLRTSAVPLAALLAVMALALSPRLVITTDQVTGSVLPTAALTFALLAALAALVAWELGSRLAASTALVAVAAAAVALIVVQPVDHPLILLSGGQLSAVGLVLTGLGVTAVVAAGRAGQPWRPALLGFAVVAGLVAPWLAAPGLLAPATSAGLAVVLAGSLLGLNANGRAHWVTLMSLAVAYGIVAASIAPGGTLGQWSNTTWILWLLVAWCGTLALSCLTLATTQRQPGLLYLANLAVMIGLIAATAAGSVRGLDLVLMLGTTGWALALLGSALHARDRALRRPLLEAGLVLAVCAAVVGLLAGAWVALASPLGVALLLLAGLLVLYATMLRRTVLAECASGLFVCWLVLRLAGAGFTDIVWVSTPVGLWLALLALLYGWRRQAQVANAFAVASAVVALGPPLAQGLVGTSDSWRYALLAGGLALAYLLVGLRWRLRAPTSAGVISLSLIAGYQAFNRLQALPSWIILGLLGSLMLAAAVALLLRREAIGRAGSELRQSWEAWR